MVSHLHMQLYVLPLRELANLSASSCELPLDLSQPVHASLGVKHDSGCCWSPTMKHRQVSSLLIT